MHLNFLKPFSHTGCLLWTFEVIFCSLHFVEEDSHIISERERERVMIVLFGWGMI